MANKASNNRMTKLLIALNQYWDSYAYYDDDTDETVVSGSEDDCYNFVMRDEELHFLTSESVKDIIHLLFTDWASFETLCRIYKAY